MGRHLAGSDAHGDVPQFLQRPRRLARWEKKAAPIILRQLDEYFNPLAFCFQIYKVVPHS